MRCYLFLWALPLLFAGCRSGENGAEAGKAYCQCLQQQGPYYADARANAFAVERICDGKLMEQYASYRLYMVNMNFADTSAAISPGERESSRLFMLDFFQAQNDCFPRTTPK